MISNCGHDENGRYSGGMPGDQTGQEYCVRTWFDRPWGCVLRHTDKQVGLELAKVAIAAANNRHIGYNQMRRGTYYIELKLAGWEPSKIKRNCEADCSSSTCANVIAVGHRLKKKKLQSISPALTTSSLKAALKAAGFEVLTDEKYRKKEDHLMPGDILLLEGHHVAINVTKGKMA